MNKNNVLIQGKRITLEFANTSDKRLIYELLVSPEIINQMFDINHPAPTWEEFNEETDELYSGTPNQYGAYLLIKINGLVIGSISYTLLNGKINCVELDIWISSTTNTGKGYGTEALTIMMDFIKSYYHIQTFIIRPWIKNINAIKAYKKCGFKEIDEFNPVVYYSSEFLEKYGDGDYGKDETINMIKENL